MALQASSDHVTLHSNAWLTLPLTKETQRMALVLLNTPPRPAAALRTLWSLSSYRVCADAAANRLLESIQLAIGEEGLSGSLEEMKKRLREQQRVARQHQLMVPDVITGVNGSAPLCRRGIPSCCTLSYFAS